MNIVISAVIALLVAGYTVDAGGCTASRVKCKTNTTFTFCVDLGYATINLDHLSVQCPEGLYCNEHSCFPCVSEAELPPIGIGAAKPILTTSTWIPSIITQSSTANPIIATASHLPSSTTLPILTTTHITLNLTSLGTTTTLEGIKPLTTWTPGQTASSLNTTTEVPTRPPCPNPPPGKSPQCQRTGTTFPGPVCTKYYECIPIWLSIEAREQTCGKGKAYSAIQKRCISPPEGCVCAD